MRPKVWRALNQQYAGLLDGMDLKVRIFHMVSERSFPFSKYAFGVQEMEKSKPAELAQLRQKPL